MISLLKITKENFRECISLKVAASQANYVMPNVHSLALAYVHYDTVTPFGIYSDDTMVGFMLLRFHHEYSSYFIWQLMIDERYQARGYGRQALEQAIAWMKHEKRCERITVSFDEGNEAAERLYKQLGFKYMEVVGDGEIDMELPLRA